VAPVVRADDDCPGSALFDTVFFGETADPIAPRTINTPTMAAGMMNPLC
jgi:hypothetical protein